MRWRLRELSSRSETSMVTVATILEEVTSETTKIKRDYPYLTIWQAIELATKVIGFKYKKSEIVEVDD